MNPGVVQFPRLPWPWGNFCVLFTWRKVASAMRVTRCCRTGNPPLEVALGQRKTHVNSYMRRTMHRGKVDPGVSELPRGNKLSRDHVNRPLLSQICDQPFHLYGRQFSCLKGVKGKTTHIQA